MAEFHTVGTKELIEDLSTINECAAVFVYNAITEELYEIHGGRFLKEVKGANPNCWVALYIDEPFLKGNIKFIENTYNSINLNSIDPTLFTQDEERDLFETIKQVKMDINESITNDDLESAVSCPNMLNNPLKNFFDKVTVNVEDISIRKNRYSLINEVTRTFRMFADFSNTVR